MRIQEESRTLATITFQNLFRIYKKLVGHDRHGRHRGRRVPRDLQARRRRRSRPTSRSSAQDDDDLVYKTEREKFTARRSSEILEHHERASPSSSARPASRRASASRASSTKKKIPHNVLNAKHHENEAFVVAQAGRKGAITVSTNMAGRGTDIILGGNAEMIASSSSRSRAAIPDAEPEEFDEARREVRGRAARPSATRSRELGGLHILGTERHESRRIDNQLRGRAGRQGDPGSARSTCRSKTT